ncbi:hypothetical protein OH784_18780 [Ectobacillus funiculus]|uniref:hypothetical protein n=1 Tax=Ectobacillus funiculus TaxID=137993 RepID=UPI00397BC1F8
MEAKHNIGLSSPGIFPIWSEYLIDSMGNCILRYLLNILEDTAFMIKNHWLNKIPNAFEQSTLIKGAT